MRQPTRNKKMNYSIQKKIKIISIDVANKSLAIACLEIFQYDANKILNQLYIATAVEAIQILTEYVDNIKIKTLEVVDLLPGKQVKQSSSIERTEALYKYLCNFTKAKQKWFDQHTHLVIEYQMGPNKKSGEVQCQVIYHFLSHINSRNIHIVGPSMKNKLSMKDPKSKHSYHIAKYDTLYCANKSHTRYIFLEWLAARNETNKLINIKRKNYSDIADAFCQAIAWYLTSCN